MSPRAIRTTCLSLATLALIGALSVNINAPFYGAFETLSAKHALTARNHVRYGLSVTKALDNTSPGGLEGEDFERHWYYSHPPLTGLYTAAFFTVFGDSVASARMSAILLTALTLPLFWYCGTRLGSRSTGFWAALLYAAAGLTLWDARKPTQLPPCLLFMMLALAFYLAWLEKPSGRKWAGFIAGVALACFADWMGYLFGSALLLHLFFHEERRHWRRALLSSVAMPLVLGIFLLHVWLVVGPEILDKLSETAGSRLTSGSRLAALWVTAKASATHIGLFACLAAFGALALPKAATASSRRLLWFLAGYGLISVQIFVKWTANEAYMAAWFMFPAIVLAGAEGMARLVAKVREGAFRHAVVVVFLLACVGQGVAFGVFRHRQTSWHVPDREVVRVLKESVPRGSWVVTPLAGLSRGIQVYETDCNIFWGTRNRAGLETILERGRPLYVLAPKPESKAGFWKGWSEAAREQMGVQQMDEDCRTLLEGGKTIPVEGYDLYLLSAPAPDEDRP